jgi:hypothetical protein
MSSAPLRYSSYLLFAVALGWVTLGTVLAGVAIASWTVEENGPPVAFLVLSLSPVAVLWYCVLFVAIIEARLWPDDGRLEFRSLLRSRKMNVADVVDVDLGLRGLNQRVVNIRYRRGGYRRPVARLSNLKSTWDLVERIHESNPSVEIKRRPVDPWRTTT